MWIFTALNVSRSVEYLSALFCNSFSSSTCTCTLLYSFTSTCLYRLKLSSKATLKTTYWEWPGVHQPASPNDTVEEGHLVADLLALYCHCFRKKPILTIHEPMYAPFRPVDHCSSSVLTSTKKDRQVFKKQSYNIGNKKSNDDKCGRLKTGTILQWPPYDQGQDLYAGDGMEADKGTLLLSLSLCFPMHW